MSIIYHFLVLCGFALFLQPPSPAPSEAGQIAQDETPEAHDKAQADGNDAEGQLLSLDEPKTDPDRQPHQDKAAREDDKASYEWWSWMNATAVSAFTGILVLFTLFQVIFLWSELKATQDAAKAAVATVEQMRLEHRAWLGATAVKLEPMEVGKQLRSKLFIENTGRTPGRVYELQNYTILIRSNDGSKLGPEHAVGIDEGIERSINAIPLDKTTTVIMPGTTIEFPNYKRIEPLTALEIDEIKSGVLRLFAATVFSFEDIATNRVYENLRFTFCYVPEVDDFLTYGSRVSIK